MQKLHGLFVFAMRDKHKEYSEKEVYTMTLFNLGLTKETDRLVFTVNDAFGESEEQGEFYVSFVRDDYVIVEFDVDGPDGKGRDIMSLTFDTDHDSNELKFEYPLYNGCITLFINVFENGPKDVTVDLKQ